MATPAPALPTRQKDDFTTVLANSFKLIGASWEAFKLNFNTFVVVYFIPTIILLAGATFVTYAYLADSENGKTQPDIDLSPISLAAVIVGALGVIALTAILSIATILTQLASARGTKLSVKDAINQSSLYFWKFIALGIISVLIVLLGFVAFIIPGFLAIFFLFLATMVLVDKNTGPVDALKESYELTKRNWKLVLSYFIVAFVIQIPSNIPVYGAFLTLGLSIAYLCLPAILYVRAQKQNPVKPNKK